MAYSVLYIVFIITIDGVLVDSFLRKIYVQIEVTSI